MSRSGPRRGSAAPQVLLALALVLADSSVVTLALPAILREFDSVVNTVAWVLISFNLALALLALTGARLARGRARRAFGIALVAFALASVACAAAPSLSVLIAARALQGVFGAVVVAAALELLVVAAGRDRAILLWAGAGVLGAAVGPALGGFLTEAFSWEAMFALQAPVALVTIAALRWLPRDEAVADAAVAPGGPAPVPARPAPAPLVALALASAALSAALFLLVILLIEGWRHSPAEAALTVTVMPIAALVAGRWAREREGLVPAIAGSVLVAGGLAALGLLPSAEAYWTLVPQLAIGAGLGLALATLIAATVGDAGAGAAGDAPAAVAAPAAWTIAARHAGIVIGLLALTPIFTADLETVRSPAERSGFSKVLDAPLGLGPKIALARQLDRQVQDAAAQELPDLDEAFAGLDVKASDRPAITRLRSQLHDELDRAATKAFRRSFLAAAILALLAAGAAAVAFLAAGRAAKAAGSALGGPDSNGSPPGHGARLAVAVPGAFAVAALLVAVYVALGGGSYGPQPVADACKPRQRPAVEKTQLIALAALDGTACKLRTTREDLIRDLLNGKLPQGRSNDELNAALIAGVDRAEREDALGSIAATGLRLAVKTGGPLAIVNLLLGAG